MPLESRVTWKGLKELSINCAKTTKQRQVYRDYVEQFADDVKEAYVENLSGGAPSTAAQPLPVGVRTGQLRGGVEIKKGWTGPTTQSQIVVNAVPHAGFIEFGTRKMAPRRPLKDAVDQFEVEVNARMLDVVQTVFRRSGF